ncbi:Acyl-CoA dehydrogenase [Arthrobacter sp. 49Tsu3.1M3]|uniref:acyl-CoA dehydrogenase family protein n=1 Tax=Arthrobacter sp. 49Tsu3.1M3 TaxID=1279029 RepID=UPI0009A5E99D|nr:acyl-CoA dehydrogenase family protein [Arthrobacter sp. 49Tsu3.1M3]SKB43949.1 Acyl-CoA dehydrogenase [Arthrobacter sp. 49Tsu3.1M3]
MQDNVSEDDQHFLAEITRFVDEEVIPAADGQDAAEEYPLVLIKRMKELGFFAASGRSLVTYSLALEELARGWLSLIPVANAHTSSVWTIKNHGTEAQKGTWLESLKSGEIVSCLGLSEPHAGSDLQNTRSTAQPKDNGWVIDAHKTYITHSDHSDSMMILVRTAPWEPGNPGLSLFMLRREEWHVIRKLPKLGTKGIETCEIEVNALYVPQDRLIGGIPGKGFAHVMDALEVGRLAVASAAVGLGRSALWNAVEYTKTREAFGTAVASMPAVQTTFAVLANKLAAAKALTLWAASRKNEGGRHDVETSAAKVVAAEAAVEIALKAMELAGGSGYIEDNRFARLLRDATLFLAGEGSNGVLNALIGNKTASGSTDLSWI